MKKPIKRATVKFLKLFISIDEIPFTDNGQPKIYGTMFIFGFRIASQVYPAKFANR
ncbi:hypothetical protein [Chryseobacterium sp. R2A-55]|uniref:hypothetical protein n=1 Tax=Chryseobacterium sp. R2A-55 TaxID=2744445 RepID=UPI001F18EC2C|nr:hypothetical protein [Chryseobacterium sp. R2A-55]